MKPYELKSYLCQNYYDGEWHEHIVKMTDNELNKILPTEDRENIKSLKVGQGYINHKAGRSIIRLS